eukprot:7446379-Pyramimonas_sp.AAC.1
MFCPFKKKTRPAPLLPAMRQRECRGPKAGSAGGGGGGRRRRKGEGDLSSSDVHRPSSSAFVDLLSPLDLFSGIDLPSPTSRAIRGAGWVLRGRFGVPFVIICILGAHAGRREQRQDPEAPVRGRFLARPPALGGELGANGAERSCVSVPSRPPQLRLPAGALRLAGPVQGAGHGGSVAEVPRSVPARQGLRHLRSPGRPSGPECRCSEGRVAGRGGVVGAEFGGEWCRSSRSTSSLTSAPAPFPPPRDAKSTSTLGCPGAERRTREEEEE